MENFGKLWNNFGKNLVNFLEIMGISMKFLKKIFRAKFHDFP